MKDNKQQTKTRSISFRADEACQRAISAYIEQTGLKQSDAIRRLIEGNTVTYIDGKPLVECLNRIYYLLESQNEDDSLTEVKELFSKLLEELRNLLEGGEK